MRDHRTSAIVFLVSLVVAALFILSLPKKVSADCGDCFFGTCIDCSYTYYYDCPLYPGGPTITCSEEYPDTCCHIYGEIPCTYCDNLDVCYVNGCPPPGDDDDDDDVPLPPANTPTPTPPNPGTITAVARQVSASDTSCSAVENSPTGMAGTTFEFSASSANQPPVRTQADNVPVTFGGQPPGWYTLVDTAPDPNYVLVQSCMYKDSVLTGLGRTAYLNGGETVSWELGYTIGTPWVQTQGGDVYSSGTLRSYIPPGTSPRVFNTDGAGGYPGIVTYGTSFDFDAGSGSQGGAYTSSTNWLVNATNTTVNYYDYFYRRYGAPATPTTEPVFSNLLAVTEPPTSETPYYVAGDMTTSGNWAVGDGESIVVIVDGNLTIGGRINITGSGFAAFIVNGNITVDPSVGTGATSEEPVVEGVYITPPTGTFITGASTVAATSRFVGKGMFIAGGFLLQRDLEDYGDNTAYSSELFLYNPRLLLTMPLGMMEMPVKWQEVAP